jgi:hypothetical protein
MLVAGDLADANKAEAQGAVRVRHDVLLWPA